MNNITIYHNPACGTSRNTLALIKHAGLEPTVIEYLKTPPTKQRLIELVLALLPVPKLEPFTKEDGEVIIDTGARQNN